MPATANKGLRYPAATDRVADGATAIQHLAEDVDAAIADAAWAALAAGTAAAGWTQGSQVRKKNGLTFLAIQVTRNAGQAVIGPASATGNIGDTTMMTLPVGQRPGQNMFIAYQLNTTAAGTGRVNTDGTVTIDTLYPTAQISPTDVIRAWVCFPAEG